MKRKLRICMGVMVTTSLLALSLGCRPQPTVEPPLTPTPEEPPVNAPEKPLLSEEIVTCLNELHTKAMREITAEIADFDRQIANIQDKQMALMEIKTKIDDTVTYLDEEVAHEVLKTHYWWEFFLPKEDFDFFVNEYYELVEFELKWLARSKEEVWELDRDITIMDRETGAKGRPEIIEKELNQRYSGLVSTKAVKSQAKEEASQILTQVLEQEDAWEIREASDNVYLISGYGLGYTEQLSVGEWYYYEDSKTIEPLSLASKELRDAITAKD